MFDTLSVLHNDLVALQNEMKIAGAATEILYNDPSRRFVPGFTIERNDLRFWMFSRSHIAVSKVVNFHKVRYALPRSTLSVLTMVRRSRSI